MKLNNRQKIILQNSVFLILGVLILWLSFGAQIFTKTQILIERQDSWLDLSYMTWKNQFILGLDYTLIFSFIIILVSSFIVFTNREKVETK